MAVGGLGEWSSVAPGAVPVVSWLASAPSRTSSALAFVY